MVDVIDDATHCVCFALCDNVMSLASLNLGSPYSVGVTARAHVERRLPPAIACGRAGASAVLSEMLWQAHMHIREQ